MNLFLFLFFLENLTCGLCSSAQPQRPRDIKKKTQHEGLRHQQVGEIEPAAGDYAAIIKSRWQLWFPCLCLCFFVSLAPSVPIFHCSWQVFHTLFCICIELMYISFCWSANIGTSMCSGPLKNVIHELVLASRAVSHMSCSSYLEMFWNGR